MGLWFRLGIGVVTSLVVLFCCWSVRLQGTWVHKWQPKVEAASRSELAEPGSVLALYAPPPGPCGKSTSLSGPSTDDLPHGPFISESKNPCWWNRAGDNSGSLSASKLNCLPYFFLAGVSKCGSTDIFSRISGHPQVVVPGKKEPRWFDWMRYVNTSFSVYVSTFSQASWQISRDISLKGSSDKVVGDGSPTYIWRNLHWAQYAGNEGCVEPRYVIPHSMHALLPFTRVILTFRNPTTSLYSKYLAKKKKGDERSPEHFHRLVEREVGIYRRCFAEFSVRRCAYNVTLSMQAQVRLEKGLYAVFLADWLRVFSRHQFHILRLEDYSQDIAAHLRDIFAFLQLKPMAERELRELSALPTFNKGHHYSKVGGMLPATQRLLTEFYTPFNAQLASLLQDRKYLWTDG